MPQLRRTTWAMIWWTLLCAVAAIAWGLSGPSMGVALVAAIYWIGMTALLATWLVMRPFPMAYIEEEPALQELVPQAA